MEMFQEEEVISDLSFSPTSWSSHLAPLVHDGRFHEDRAFLDVVHGKAQRDYRASFGIRRWPPNIGCGMEKQHKQTGRESWAARLSVRGIKCLYARSGPHCEIFNAPRKSWGSPIERIIPYLVRSSFVRLLNLLGVGLDLNKPSVPVAPMPFTKRALGALLLKFAFLRAVVIYCTSKFYEISGDGTRRASSVIVLCL